MRSAFLSFFGQVPILTPKRIMTWVSIGLCVVDQVGLLTARFSC